MLVFAWREKDSKPANCRAFLQLQVELLEDALGNVADDEHDGQKEEWHIERVHALVYGFDNGRGHLVYVGELLRALHPRGHRGLHRARLDRNYGHALAVNAVAQSAQVSA